MTRKFVKRMVAVLFVAYLITWIFGVPAAENEILRSVMREHAAFAANNPQPRQFEPMVSIGLALPLLPFLVLVKHEYLFAPVYGAGSIDLFLWFPWSIQRVRQFHVWVA